MNWLIDYYHGWLEGGFFHWAYPVNGIAAPVEPWHTPVMFWMIHGMMALLIVALFARACYKYIAGVRNAK